MPQLVYHKIDASNVPKLETACSILKGSFVNAKDTDGTYSCVCDYPEPAATAVPSGALIAAATPTSSHSSMDTSFDRLAGVPVHYDRLPPVYPYGSKGDQRQFSCKQLLQDTLTTCFDELFEAWNKGKPSIILTAGTTGDGGGAHGQGYAFDLDGFYWGEEKFMMNEYSADRVFYNGINAHLFLHFSQVLSFHYPGHHDHFHVDFNFSHRFRTSSNAQTYFVQSCVVYIYGKIIGSTGVESDGVDGVWGADTKNGVRDVLQELGLSGQGGLTKPDVWKEFLRLTRDRAFA